MATELALVSRDKDALLRKSFSLECRYPSRCTGWVDSCAGQVDAIFIRSSHIERGIGRKMLRVLEMLVGNFELIEVLDPTLNAEQFALGCGRAGDSVLT